MTSDRMQLTGLLEKAGAGEIVRDMIDFVTQRLMELDVDNRCDASHDERTEARTNSRNGRRPRLGGPRRHGAPAYSQAALRQLLPPSLEPRRGSCPAGHTARGLRLGGFAASPSRTRGRLPLAPAPSAPGSGLASCR